MKKLKPSRDPLGNAVYDFYHDRCEHDIMVESDHAATDIIPVAHLFRSGNRLPVIERKALEQCHGRVLDVGAGAGCHSIILQNRGIDVSALEISELCCNIMQLRGIRQIINADFYSYSGEIFDTILCLMNGIGIAGTCKGLERFLKQAGTLLKPGGRIIFDSSDIEYLYDEEDGSKLVNLNAAYYGELTYLMHYKEITGDPFKWLFIDFDTLKRIASAYDFEAVLLVTGDHYDYLGMMMKL